MLNGVVKWVVLLGAACACCALAGCGDSESSDKRGYTKAPLEHAGLFIKPEQPSAMKALGAPLMPKLEVIPAPKDAAPAAKKP